MRPRQQQLFEHSAENKAIAARFQESLRDRRVARWLISAYDGDIEEVQDMLWFDSQLTLYAAIELMIKAERSPWQEA